MTEDLLSFIWKYKLYDAALLDVDGQSVEVLHPGDLNTNSGPDFFNTKIRIGETVWAGNAEIHIKSSDWNLHNHHKNQAFDNVILHIVANNDQAVQTSKGREVPTLQLKIDKSLQSRYHQLMSENNEIPCALHLAKIDPFIMVSLLAKLGIERLEQRTASIFSNMESTTNNLEESFYRQIARSFGFHVNSQAFELLAKATPYIILQKYSHKLPLLEALLFGQAGLLVDDYNDDSYYKHLKTEYTFLQAKHNLTPIDTHLWKFMRLRPGNFPTIRIAQLAALIHKYPALFSRILEVETVSKLVDLLAVPVSDYWFTHYTFATESAFKSKHLGSDSAKVIIINTLIPFYFAYGKMNSQAAYQDKALSFLEGIEPEDNSVLTKWKEFGIKPKNAYESQALLQLSNEYCSQKRCLHCAVGAKVMAATSS